MIRRRNDAQPCNNGLARTVSSRWPFIFARSKAPRWIQTQDDHNTVLEPARPEDDWLLISGELVAGRVLHDRSGPQAGRFVWSLTGPTGSPIGNHGTVETFEEAQKALLASWR